MPGAPQAVVRAISIGLLAVLVSGCGGDDEPGLIPADSSERLLELLVVAEERFDKGECDELESTMAELDREADHIPDADVDARLRTTLNAEIQELREMTDRCKPAEEEVVTEPAPAPVPPPTTVPETTAPAPVEPTTTEETEQTTEETKDEKPPKPEAPPKPEEQDKSPTEEKPPKKDPCANDSPRC